MTDKHPSRQPSASSSSIRAPRPRKPVSLRALDKQAEDIELSAEILDQAEEVTAAPQISNLKSNQHVAQCEIQNGDGTIDQVFVVVQAQQSAPKPPSTPHSTPQSGTAAYYDDCVSDYSHEQSRPSTPTQPPRSPRQRATPRAPYAHLLDDPADYRTKFAMDGINKRNAMGTGAAAPFASDKSVILMTSMMGEMFQVVKVYMVKAIRKTQQVDYCAKYTSLRDRQSVVVARLVSFGKSIASQAMAEAEQYRRELRELVQPASQPHREFAIRVLPTHNDIHPTIHTLPREEMIEIERRRRAATRFPENTAVNRKSVNMPLAGPLVQVGHPHTRKPLPAVPKEGSLRRMTPPPKQAQPNYNSPPRRYRRDELKPVVNSGIDVQSQRGSLAVASEVGSSISRSATPSSGRWTPRQPSTPASSQRGSSEPDYGRDPHAIRQVPWANMK